MDKADVQVMREVVVTSTRTEKELGDAPGSVNIVTASEMKKRGVKDVDEALNTTAGVITSRSKGPMDTIAGIALRGIPDSGRTLVLVDGLALNDPYSNGVNFSGMASEDLERIEVVKGPFSSLYGGNAMGGVVSIITRMPTKREFTLKTGYGSAWDREADNAPKDYRTVYASYGDRIGRFSLLASYDYRTTNGYAANQVVTSSKPTSGITGWSTTQSTKGVTNYLIGDKGDNAWSNDNLRLKGRYEFSSVTSLSLSYARTTSEYDYPSPNTYLRDASGNAVWSYGSSVTQKTFLGNLSENEKNTYGAVFETTLRSAKVKACLGYTDLSATWYTTPGTGATSSGGAGTLTSYPSNSWNGDIQVTIPFFEHQVLTFGGAFRKGSIDRQDHKLTNWRSEDTQTTLTYVAAGEDRTLAIFLDDEIALHEKVTAFVGVRADWWKTRSGSATQYGTGAFSESYGDRSDASLSPKVAFVYKLSTTTTLRASAGQAFRSPTLYQLYVSTTMGTSTTLYASNPDLKPEKVTAWDLSIDQRTWKGGKIKATYFENRISDMIYSTTGETIDGIKVIDRVNAGKGKSRGLELEAEQRFQSGLRFFANFTYTDSEIVENDAKPTSEGKEFTYVPRRMVNLGGDYGHGPFGINVTGRYMSKRYGSDDNSDIVNGVYGSYDPFFTVDATLRYQTSSWASFSLSGTNLSGKRYYVSTSLAPGRAYFAEMTMKF
ncbi:TonB-dependent receptor [Holophaga foetida]|uniref:TonB-dependent receptor n=1 Tax=Holophaga foetida TaxID=35839 RepID=UPI0002E61439|nr:TonB-dependent receptor [Holophaga foetida]